MIQAVRLALGVAVGKIRAGGYEYAAAGDGLVEGLGYVAALIGGQPAKGDGNDAPNVDTDTWDELTGGNVPQGGFRRCPRKKGSPLDGWPADWEDYDAIVGPYLSGSAFEDSIGCPAWPMPFSEDFPDARRYGGLHSDAYASMAAALVAECSRHFSAKLDAPYQMFLWPYRGKVSAEGYDQYVVRARIARAADARTPLLSTLPPAPPKLSGWTPPEDFGALADIIAPPAQWLEPATAGGLARPEHPLAGIWLSPGTPPYLPSLGLIATPADVRAIPWFAMKYDCTGLFLPEVMHWRGEPFATAAGAETRLFYPGRFAGIEGVLPSIRLKRLRRGLQDIAYLWLLQLRERGAIAQAVMDALTRYAGLQAVGDHYLDPRLDGWVQDPKAWILARRLLAEEVQAAVHPTEMSNRELLARRLAWRRFSRQTRTVKIEQLRARVTPAEKAPRLRATILMDLYNQYSRKVDVHLKLGRLPQGWTATTPEVSLSAMPAASRRVVALAAEGDYVPTGVNAKMPLSVVVTQDLQRREELTVQVPLLKAPFVAGAPRVDGLLNDWPMRAGNAAGDFKLIGKRGERGAGLAKRQTTCFVLHDRTNLYIAFRCDEPDLAGLVAKPNNIIHYEQLMACGEDLVEVILDPGADGKGPEDLYHIVIKANGVLLTERGVHTDPPLGAARPWPVAALVAVKKTDKLWTVELAIPLHAFGDEAKARFWGVNFTRFATQGAEASSWAGAKRYFYDPRNLGTMFIPQEE